MAEKVTRLGVKREAGYLYFLRGTDVYKTPMKKAGQKSAAGKATLICNGSFEREEGYLYFLDHNGDISRSRRAAVGKKPRKRKSRSPELNKGPSVDASTSQPSEEMIGQATASKTKVVKKREEFEVGYVSGAKPTIQRQVRDKEVSISSEPQTDVSVTSPQSARLLPVVDASVSQPRDAMIGQAIAQKSRVVEKREEPQADVLIVTVTKVETRAVVQAFEQVTGQKSQTVPIGDRVYRNLGEVNGTRVFLALSEMGAGGLGASQQAVRKGIEALQPATVIMTGIAFGVSEGAQAIGDILVSQHLRLYDLQRLSRDEIILRGDRPHASPFLVNRLQSAYIDWDGATVRFGLMLCGEKLVDNVDYREQLKRCEPEAIGGEMEGAGLYVACQDANVDWILVKAVCDWADGNKAQDKDSRQKQAAQNAASFLLHALQHAPLKRQRPKPAGTH